MIDKLVLAPLYADWDSFPTIGAFHRRLRQEGYSLSSAQRWPSEIGLFYYVQEHPDVYFKANRAGKVLAIYTNPSRFTTLSDYLRFMSILDSESFSLAETTRIRRIDYAIRIFQSFDHVVQGTNIRYRQHRVRYQGRGTRNTGIYYGAEPDVISIYNESEYIRRRTSRRRQDPINAELVRRGHEITKIERQIQQPAKIRRFANRQDDLNLDSLESHLMDIIEGRIDPLASLTFQHVSLLQRRPTSFTSAQIERAAELRGAMRIAPFTEVRRRFNTHNNFSRLYSPMLVIESISTRYQPSELLRQSLRRHLGMSSRRIPPSLFSSPTVG